MTKKRVIIIAEAGVNHNGSLKIAKKLISAAKDIGADYIKFQSFKAEKLVTKNAELANYQKKNTEDLTQYKMIKKLELNTKQHLSIIDFCKKKKIGFLSTGFDNDSVDFLIKKKIDFIKIPSGEINNLPYLKHNGSKKKKIILSTGMSFMWEIKNALKILISNGAKKKDIIVLHCNSEYPTPYQDVNLKAMNEIKKKTKCNIGLSDHSSGIEVPIAAVALGAKIIEKHFTLDKRMLGPDHVASLEPNEFKQMVTSIRNIEVSLGSSIKKPSNSEKKNIKISRRSIVAKINITKGEKFSPNNITLKRPGSGLSPIKWFKVIGKISKKNFKKDEFIELN